MAESFPNPDLVFKPQILRLTDPSDKVFYHKLISENEISLVQDRIYFQLRELIRARNPNIKFGQESDYDSFIKEYLKGMSLNEYGVWVYYPWNRNLIHILEEDAFIEVRTNRNREKISQQEQELLNKKVIGIAGLSVGQSIALTIAMERVCGELRLADFDNIELSNLNRLRTGLQNLGLQKTIVAAREIAEIDPFIKVKIYNEGLNKDNMDSFFMSESKQDLFIEVCDSIQVKLDSRYKAREYRIPVVMDTNDRGMIDIERFDLEPARSIFHGMIDGFVNESGFIEVNPNNQIEVFKALVSFESLSERMKLSMKQINHTITSWPQLASSVVLGGAVTTDICRRILLQQHSSSGRYYVDLDQIIN